MSRREHAVGLGYGAQRWFRHGTGVAWGVAVLILLGAATCGDAHRRGLRRGLHRELPPEHAVVAALEAQFQPTMSPSADAPEVPFPPRVVELHVIRVIDPALPPIDPADAALMYVEAKATVQAKLGFSGLRFIDRGQVTAREFFDRWLPPPRNGATAADARDLVRPGAISSAEAAAPVGDDCAGLLRDRYDPARGDPDFTAVRPRALAFLKRWTVEELRAFFPEAEQAPLIDHEAVLAAIEAEYGRKIALLKALNGPDGRPLVEAATARERSFAHWLCAMRRQDQYDLVLTNAFVLLDVLSQPHVHGILRHAKAGGIASPAPARIALEGRALMASTFHLDTTLPFFRGEAPPVDRELRNRVTGVYVLAHEIGHALFRMPDLFDVPPHCLMGNAHDGDYVEGFRHIVSVSGACERELPWLWARARFFHGDRAILQGRFSDAVDDFKAVLTDTPRPVDGALNEYHAVVVMRMVRALAALGQWDRVGRGIAKALQLDPRNRDAAAWRTRDPAQGYDPALDPWLEAARLGLAEAPIKEEGTVLPDKP